MTALLELEQLPQFSSLDFWVAAYSGTQRVAELELNEQITEADADQRIAWYAQRTDLTVEARNDAYEQLKDATRRLSCLNMPGGCCCHDYTGRDVEAELDADADARNAIKKLIGERP